MEGIAQSYAKEHHDELVQKFPEWRLFQDETKVNMARRVAGVWYQEKTFSLGHEASLSNSLESKGSSSLGL